ncbi:hypothetical protein [Winogradskyella helgolandensis]|uniref:hypothetical protein n=1 Tax=Winogradskyella helgolandensis TaxID=2697010 RepID=UPI0015BD6641|nr:hypothetical protein [Winogradskyella helgolandensis]
METKKAEEIGIVLRNIPDILSVVINKDELELSNVNKLFQFALKDEIADGSDDILVYLAEFDNESQIVMPLMASSFDEKGMFRKDLLEVFPPIYRKKKDSLFVIE